MFIWIIAYIALFETKRVSGLECLSCTDISHPQLCKQTVSCGQGEVCGMEKFLTAGGDIKFTLNCVAQTWCQTHVTLNIGRNLEKRENFMLCYNCCNEDLCNSGSCGELGYKALNKTVCYNCNDEANQHCSTIQICNDNEICYIHETRDFMGTYFNSGCRRRSLCNALVADPQAVGRRKREGLCFKCCEGSLCNDNCTGHCTDQPECHSLMAHYNVCSNKLVASRICPQTCRLCQAQTTQNVLPSNCTDGSANCEYLNTQYEICNNRKAVEDLACYKTCKLCDGTVSPVNHSEHTIGSTKSTTQHTVLKTTTTTQKPVHKTTSTLSATTMSEHTKSPTTLSPHRVCRNGWINIGESCKLILSPARTWMDANAECRKQGGYLLIIQDSTEQNILDKYLAYYDVNIGTFWIGLKEYPDGFWHWVENGQIVRYSKWLPYQTTRSQNGKCAVYGSMWSYFWATSDCNNSYDAICEY